MLLLNCSLLSQVPITWTISILFSNDSKLMDPPFSPTLVQLSKRFQPPMPLTINSSAIPFSFYTRRRSPHLLLSNCLMIPSTTLHLWFLSKAPRRISTWEMSTLRKLKSGAVLPLCAPSAMTTETLRKKIHRAERP